MTDQDDLRYPVGRFHPPAAGTPSLRAAHIETLRLLPERLRTAVGGLSEAQLDTPYRDDGWTVRQVVHHVPDSHMNCYVRWRLALTEDEPTIKPYDEAKWAELHDSRTVPVEVSLQLLESLHDRWVNLMGAMSGKDFQRKFRHPENGVLDLNTVLAGYAWHCRHHEAHITGLRQRMGWV